MVDEKEWLASFMAIYEKSTPLIHVVSKLDAEGQPASLNDLADAHYGFTHILKSAKNLPTPKQRELKNIKNDFERTLASVIKAGEMAAKMLDDIRAGSKLSSRMHYSSMVGYIGHASVYHSSLLRGFEKVGITAV